MWDWWSDRQGWDWCGTDGVTGKAGTGVGLVE